MSVLLAFHFLFFALIFVCAPSEAVDDVLKHANRGVLKELTGKFQLAGNARPSMKEINGGRLCVNAFGKSAAGWFFTAHVSLDQCAAIAHEQPGVLGFRWGRTNFDYDFFTIHAEPSARDMPVDLELLFPGEVPFTCTVYVSNNVQGQPYPFHTSNRTKRLGIEAASLQDGPAQEVCFQRWTMAQFFKPRVTELWFCYMPSDSQADCSEKAGVFYFQGEVFICVFLVLLGGLGFIMRDMPQFETPLVEFSGLLLNLELGLMCVGFLLERWPDTGSFAFFLVAYVLNIVASFLIFVPYYVMEKIDENSPFNTAYLLFVAFSPCFLLEFASYWSHFILLVGHLPLLVGFMAYASIKLGGQGLGYVSAYFQDDAEEKEPEKKHVDIDEKISYHSVPTEEEEGELLEAQSRRKVPCGMLSGAWSELAKCGRRS